MPFSVDSDTWKNGDEIESIKTRIREFLEANPDQAYSLHEISDAVVSTNWGRLEEILQESDEEDSIRVGDLRDEIGDLDRMRNTKNNILVHLSDPMTNGVVTARYIPAEETDYPGDAAEIPHYTINN